jgi:GNAT superfamily N-acetyltransferase
MTYTFALDPNPSPADVEAIHAGLSAFNQQFVSGEGAGPVTIFLRDEQGELAGGLLGFAWWGWLHIEILWLAEAARRQDFGSRMLALAEHEAAQRGCHHAFVDTMSWQALPFYQKRGYSVWGQLDDFPAGQTRYFLKKAIG